jgi:hypothetical protein
MSRILQAVRRKPWAIVAVVAAALLSVGAASAGARAENSEIEYAWTFEHGEVGIKPAANGELVGIVLQPTQFAVCAHEAGEEMWTDLAPQPDGSYWGLHQWFANGSCARDPTLGPTAWRVMHKPDGSKYLLVCFSEPGSTSQPTIAPDGTDAGATNGCVESEPTAPLPVVSNGGGSGAGQNGAEVVSFSTIFALPKTTLCVRRHSLKIGLHDPRRDPLKEVVVKIKRRTVAVVRGVQRLKRGIVLENLPSGSFTLKIVATTVLHQHLTGRRTYHSCGKGSSSKTQLRHPKPRRRR